MSYQASAYSRPATRNDGLTVDDVCDAILHQFATAQRWQLFDRLVGRPEVTDCGFRIAEVRISPRPCAERDAKMTYLHDEKGWTYPEIAAELHLTVRTVARACQRFRKRPKGDSDSLSPTCLPYAS